LTRHEHAIFCSETAAVWSVDLECLDDEVGEENQLLRQEWHD